MGEPRSVLDRRGRREIAVLLVVACVAAIGFAAIDLVGDHPQLLGVAAAVALGALAVALVLWAHRLLPQEELEEARPRLAPTAREHEAAADALDRDDVLERDPMLRRSLLAALGAMALAALVPLRALGPRPGKGLKVTAWQGGARAVDADGVPVLAADVPTGGLVTIFPEGHAGAADAQAVLVRVVPAELRLGTERSDWAPDGLVAYSKLCTHAGCPVGLYQAQSRTLLCPCHQSEFDVTRRAVPVAGPAARPLPQLPLVVDDDGVIRARGDFSAPVGPSWWTM